MFWNAVGHCFSQKPVRGLLFAQKGNYVSESFFQTHFNILTYTTRKNETKISQNNTFIFLIFSILFYSIYFIFPI